MTEKDERRPFRDVRRRALYSIKDLAEEAGTSTRTIVDVEHGRRVPRLATIRKLCRALDVHPMTVKEFAAAIEGTTEGKELAAA